VQIIFSGKRTEFGAAKLMLLEFREQRAEFLREAGAAGTVAKSFQFVGVPQQQGAQHHHPAFGGQQFRWRDIQLFKNELRQTVEGKNL